MDENIAIGASIVDLAVPALRGTQLVLKYRGLLMHSTLSDLAERFNAA